MATAVIPIGKFDENFTLVFAGASLAFFRDAPANTKMD
jgi:hypothetical protein